MRGKGSRQLHSPAAVRITPARAGKSSLRWAAIQTHGDHPRVCGEKARQGSGLNLRLGSPPRVRGKDSVLTFIERGGRITPACAGKSALSAGSCPCSRDHPRVCGEKNNLRQAFAVQQGSPPRMRGKAGLALSTQPQPRITPAYAGKSPVNLSGEGGIGDHPRVCGEKFHPASDRKLGRVRGTKRSFGLSPAAAPAGLAGSCPASPPWSYPPRITVSRPRP